MKLKKIICITGADGTGKSTLIKKLSKEFPDAYVATIWDLFSASENTSLFKSKTDIDNYICSLTPNSRTLFLMHALKFSVDKALSGNFDLIILDSYYYKYLSSELALGADKELVKNLIEIFPEPDLTVELSLSVEKASKRKEKYSRYECGLSKNATKENFLKFQKKINEKQFNLTDKKAIIINSELSSEEVFYKAKKLIYAKIR